MASQIYTTTVLVCNSVSSNKAKYPGQILIFSPSRSSRVRICKSFRVLSLASVAMPLTHDNESLPVNLSQNVVFSPKVDVTRRIDELKEKTRRALNAASDPTMTMNLIDTIQRLGIGYSFEAEISEILENLTHDLPDDDLYAVALRFRLHRHNGFHTNPDVFGKFLDANGKFRESTSEDIEGLLSLYEASYLGAKGEEVLSHAKEFTTRHLKKSVSQLNPKLSKKVLEGLELPRHLRMARVEARKYIEEYGNKDDHNPIVLELAKLDYNQVQLLHQMELDEITRWWRNLGVMTKLTFSRDRTIECFLWIVGLLPEPKYSRSRVEIAKTIAMLLVIDDIFDTYGSYDDLLLFTNAIQRWDLNEIEKLPEYMKICYMALYNTTNEICYEVLKEHGLCVQLLLSKTWIDLVEAYMVEIEWVKNGIIPNLENYIANGVTTSGAYMALVHLFVLIGEGANQENMNLLLGPYPHFFSFAGTILRLWDDLGTAKEEQERGDVTSSIHLFMREKNITCEEEGRKQMLKLIHSLWESLNGALVAHEALLLPIIKVALNMSRASQVVYQHNEDSYLSSVENHVQSLFFTPIDI